MPARSDRPHERRRRGGFALVELMVTSLVLMTGCVALVLSTSSTSLATYKAAQSTVAQNSLAWVEESLADVEYADLLSWNGVALDRGDHTARIAAQLVAPGLIGLEVTVADDRTGALLCRIATLRSGGA
ncbi:MAG: hypothetical protein JNL90_18420 [Planctomycetes bacterium]|nr:hypothetical protein [Planctomycetota bacterium]